MKTFNATDLTNPTLDSTRWGKYPQYLDRAVKVLNHIIRTGGLTDEEAKTRVANFRSLNNAFEMMKAGNALMAEFNVRPTDIQSTPTIHLPFSFPLSMSARPAPARIQAALNAVPPKHIDYERMLPDSVYPQRSKEELHALQAAHWKKVENLDTDNSERIMYERRFTSGMTSEPFRYYQPNIDTIQALPPVSPHQAELTIPDGTKLLIVTGYHRLEKPYGELFEKMFKEQVKYDPEKVVFLNIQNSDVLTGEPSGSSNRKIQEAINLHGATHIIDVHEQLSMGNTYIPHMSQGHAVNWYEGADVFNRVGAKEYTLDATIPTHHIELAYQGVIAPPFQHAVNQDIKEIELLVREMKCTPSPRTENATINLGSAKTPTPPR